MDEQNFLELLTEKTEDGTLTWEYNRLLKYTVEVGDDKLEIYLSNGNLYVGGNYFATSRTLLKAVEKAREKNALTNAKLAAARISEKLTEQEDNWMGD